MTLSAVRAFPANASPAGYVALIHGLELAVPPPRRLFATDERYSVREERRWTLMTPRHVPAPTLEGHLTFALRYEGVDLGILLLGASAAPYRLDGHAGQQ